MSDETTTKDAFFGQLALISDAMIAAHGKDFAMGALVLAARYIAEGDARASAAAKAGGSPSGPSTAAPESDRAS